MRPFFQVPNFEDLCAKTFSSTKTVQHSPRNLFRVVADVDRYDEFVPFCARSRVVRRHNDAHFEAELEIGFRLFNEKYLSNVTLVEDESVTAEAITGDSSSGSGSGLFERLVSTWRFKSGAHPDECVVKFDIDFRVGSVIHAQAVGLFFEEVSRMQINAFEERCDRLYGRGGRRGVELQVEHPAAVDIDKEHIKAKETERGGEPLSAVGTAVIRACSEVTKEDKKIQPWERRVLAAFEEAAVKSSSGILADDESRNGAGGGGFESSGGGGKDDRGGTLTGLGLRAFSAACAALDDIEPFAAVSSRPLLCGALHVALDIDGSGRVTAVEAVEAAKLLRQDGLLSESGGIREVNASELKAYLLDQLRALKRRMPHVARLAAQQQQPSSSVGEMVSSESAAVDAANDGGGGGGGVVDAPSGGGGGGDGFEILLQTAMADVMVEQALGGADQLAGELFEALDVDGSGLVTGGEWVAAARGHPSLLSPHTLDGILRLGVLTRQVRSSRK